MLRQIQQIAPVETLQPDSAIVGFRSPEQVDPLIEAANLQLSEDDITTIEGAQ